MVVICRVDLDKYELSDIEAFLKHGIVTLQEARQSRVVKSMNPVAEIQWTRKMQAVRDALPFVGYAR